MRVLVVPDKFKGTLTALAAARAIAAGWRRIRPRDRLTLLPMSDGGDGFGPALGALLGARTRIVTTTDAAERPRQARWWWAAERRLAIIETAESNGLALLPKGKYHPFDLDTAGIAPLIRRAIDQGARTCLLGVGGSATNDGGFGLARALGWRFLDREGRTLERWTELVRLARLEPPPLPAFRPPDRRGRPASPRFIVATDVANPLLGPRGASRIYGPQKGLKPDDVPAAEACLRRLAHVVRRQLGIDSRSAGAGAAGGLGFGLMAFLGAERRLGFEVFAEHARLDELLDTADLLITGEGGFDLQSLMGKGVGQLLRRSAQHGRPVVVLAGRVQVERALPKAVRWARGLCDVTSETNAVAEPARWLRHLAAEAAQAFRPSADRFQG